MTADSADSASVMALIAGQVDAGNAELLVRAVVDIPGASGCYVMLTDAQGRSAAASPAEGAGSLEEAARNAATAAASLSAGARGGGGVTAGEINSLACLLDAVALSPAPRLRCVPLLPAAGWTADRVALLPHVSTLLQMQLPPSQQPQRQHRPDACRGAADPGAELLPRPGSSTPQAGTSGDSSSNGGGDTAASSGSGGQAAPRQDVEAVADALERLRPPHLPKWARRRLAPAPAADAAATHGRGPTGTDDTAGGSGSSGGGNGNGATGVAQPPPDPSTSSPPLPASASASGSAAAVASCSGRYVTLVDGAPAPPDRALRFRRVAVGGTFDRLHAGHELLLAATALAAHGFVFVGVTADALLANKSHKELLQPYDVRAGEALSYLRAVRPGLQVEAGPLSDPKAPTLAELDPGMEALVVSVETLGGAAAINAGRAARGFPPLTIITVPVIGMRRGGAGGAGSGEAGGGAAGQAAAAAGPAAGVADKLSSSGLRAAEAQRGAAGAPQ